jgi:hypothetical protein
MGYMTGNEAVRVYRGTNTMKTNRTNTKIIAAGVVALAVGFSLAGCGIGASGAAWAP